MRIFSFAAAMSVTLLAGAAAFAANNQGFATKTFTNETTETFMGMSDNTPPNDHAAASQGTRTETTTESVTVEGPPGQVNNYDPSDPDSTCNNCTETDRSSSTETTDLPGADR
ncbi:MAG: hypothetical protein Q8P60_02710 [Pseudorhodobacter sp.]|nr:hypothetical protein [Pseudorhodobacter sp.]